MSNLKCPFCGGELYGCIGHPYCRNEKCEMCDEMMPQELLDLLDRTRKALDVAVDALKDIQMTYDVQYANGTIRFKDAKDIAVKSKKEIKQLIKGE